MCYSEDEVKEHEFRQLVTEHIGNLGLNITADKLIQVCINTLFVTVLFDFMLSIPTVFQKIDKRFEKYILGTGQGSTLVG